MKRAASTKKARKPVKSADAGSGARPQLKGARPKQKGAKTPKNGSKTPKGKPAASKGRPLASSMTKAELLAELRREAAEAERLRKSIERHGKNRKKLIDARHVVDEIISSAPFGAHVYELRSGRLVLIGANKSADRMLGIDHSSLKGLPVEEAFPSMLDSELLERFRALAEHEGRFGDDRFSYSDDRIVGAFEISAFNIGRRRVACFFRDVTERRKAEDELKEAIRSAEDERRKTEAVVAAMGEGISIQDLGFRITYQNQRHKELIGDHVGELCYRAYEQRDEVCTGCPVQEAFRDGRVHRMERAGITPDGGEINVEITASPVRDAEGRIIAGIELVRDITGQKTAAARQIQANKNLETILESTPYGVVIIAKDKTVIHANRAALNAMGYSSVGEIVGSVCHETLCPAQADKCPILDLGQKLDRSEKILITKDGRRLPILKTVVPVMFDDEELLLEAFVDISERKQAEDFIKSILESIDDALLVIGRDYSIVSANRAFCHSSGMKHDDVVGKKCYAITHGLKVPCGGDDHECPVRVTFETGESCVVTHNHLDAEGGEIIVEVKSYPLKDISGNVTSVIEVQNDITERLSLEEQLRHSQKMEALGTLTGGIAHEFNNIITAIMGFGEFLHEELEGQDSLQNYADMIVKSATRAAKLTEGLLAYSRKQITHMERLNIDGLVMSMREFLSRLVGSGVDLSVSASSGATVMADKAQMEQVLVNLVKNASDAMPSGGSITLTLTSRTVLPDGEEAISGVRPGDYALIEVADTGHGIDEETIQKIFEPFFTTKDVGKGTGLGLSMVYGIVEKHGGQVKVRSQPGDGATFSVYLPVTEASAPRSAQEREQALPPGSGSGTILMAEDDESIRQLISKALLDEGYSVLVASGGREAVETFMKNKGIIDMLIFDVVMPGMGGYEAYELIRAISPGIKVVFVSGCMAGDERLERIVSNGHLLISKPVSPRKLLRQVQEALSAPGPQR